MYVLALIGLVTQAVRERRATKPEIIAAAMGGKAKVMHCSNKQRQILLEYLRKLFGNLYCLFDKKGNPHIVGGTSVSAAANYVLEHKRTKCAYWSVELPQSIGGTRTSAEIFEEAKKCDRWLQHNDQTNSMYAITVNAQGQVGGFSMSISCSAGVCRHGCDAGQCQERGKSKLLRILESSKTGADSFREACKQMEITAHRAFWGKPMDQLRYAIFRMIHSAALLRGEVTQQDIENLKQLECNNPQVLGELWHRIVEGAITPDKLAETDYSNLEKRVHEWQNLPRGEITQTLMYGLRPHAVVHDEVLYHVPDPSAARDAGALEYASWVVPQEEPIRMAGSRVAEHALQRVTPLPFSKK